LTAEEIQAGGVFSQVWSSSRVLILEESLRFIVEAAWTTFNVAGAIARIERIVETTEGARIVRAEADVFLRAIPDPQAQVRGRRRILHER